jgi:acyl carrier protein
MDECDVMNTLKAILIELGIPVEALHERTHLRRDLKLDSTETVEVSLGLKRRLGVSIKLETRQDLTLAQVCSLIESALVPES